MCLWFIEPLLIGFEVKLLKANYLKCGNIDNFCKKLAKNVTLKK